MFGKTKNVYICGIIIGSDTACLKVRISQIQTKQDGPNALCAHKARAAFLIFVSGMREPSLQDRIGVRAFFCLSPNANDEAEAEKLIE